MGTWKQRTLFALAVVTLGFIGGLVIAGRLSLTTPSVAAPQPQAATVPVVPPVPIASALPDLSSIAETALKVSTNITSTTVIQPPNDPWSQFWYGNQLQRSQSLGSGVVVSSDGYILTNTHVIGNAGAEIRVTLPDGNEQQGQLVGIDEVSDLAVVKVRAQNLPTLAWGDSSQLRIAEWVLAIGNPFQLSGTVTLGIVSTVSRSGAQVGHYADFIQTDAAINPGNSGGALVNARGELVGINTMIYSETGSNTGIGFAIPSNLARRIMTELIEHGTVRWGSLGAIVWRTMNSQVARHYGLDDVTGALVVQLPRASTASRGGLTAGDIVVRFNGQTITGAEQLDRLIIGAKVGTTAKVEVVHMDGRRATLDLPIVSR
jgi:S1-C subfamily serine protease